MPCLWNQVCFFFFFNCRNMTGPQISGKKKTTTLNHENNINNETAHVQTAFGPALWLHILWGHLQKSWIQFDWPIPTQTVFWSLSFSAVENLPHTRSYISHVVTQTYDDVNRTCTCTLGIEILFSDATDNKTGLFHKTWNIDHVIVLSKAWNSNSSPIRSIEYHSEVERMFRLECCNSFTTAVEKWAKMLRCRLFSFLPCLFWCLRHFSESIRLSYERGKKMQMRKSV